MGLLSKVFGKTARDRVLSFKQQWMEPKPNNCGTMANLCKILRMWVNHQGRRKRKRGGRQRKNRPSSQFDYILFIHHNEELQKYKLKRICSALGKIINQKTTLQQPNEVASPPPGHPSLKLPLKQLNIKSNYSQAEKQPVFSVQSEPSKSVHATSRRTKHRT